MPTQYTTLLGLAKPATGELTGTWGTTVNSYITEYLDAAVAGAQVISGSQTAVTLSTTNGSSLVQAGASASGSSQYAIIRCTGNPAGLLTITAPATSKVYLVINNTSTSQSVKIVGAGPTTGVTIASGIAALVAWNGTDFALIASTDVSSLSGLGTGVATALGQNVTGSGGIVLATNPTISTSFTVNGDSSLNGAVVINEAGADKDFRVEGDTDANLLFVDASTDRVGIGTSSPGARLEVRENTSCFFKVSTALNYFTIHVLDPGTGSPPGPGLTRLTSTSDSLSIDAVSLDAACVYSTDISSGFGQRDVYVAALTGTLGYISSLRGRKTNIAPITDISWLYKLNPVSFFYKKKIDGVNVDEPEGFVQLGLIAEEVEQVRPELCFYDFLESGDKELKGVSYSSLITPLLKAIQEQQATIESLIARITALEQK